MVRDLIERGLKHHRAGRLLESKTLYEQALAIQPEHPDALHLSGVVAAQVGDAERAIELIQRAIEVQPNNPGFYADLAQAFLAGRRIADALAAFRRAAALDPRAPQFSVGAASCLAMQGSLAQAERELRSLTQRYPGYALAWYNLGNAVQEQGRHEASLEYFRRAIKLDPALVDAHNNLGRALHQLERFEEAEQAYRHCVALRPDYAIGCHNLASVLTDRGRFAEAATVCRQALERSPGSPDLLLKLGGAQIHLGELTSALEAFRAAVNAAPENPRALWAYGFALIRTGREREGLPWVERALALQPDSPASRSAMATLYLSLGNLRSGWEEYEWRPARQTFLAENPGIRLAADLPVSLHGKKICLLREQGLGDELFFLRFAAELTSRGAEIAYLAHAKLASMLRRVPTLDTVITDEVPLPMVELSALVGDLPRLLRASNFPPPLALMPLPQRLQEMKERLAGLGPPPYLGLTWRAGVAPQDQRGTNWVLHKNISLDDLGAALRDIGGTILALQRRPESGEIERLAGIMGKPLHDLTALNDDLEDMLALQALLDEYIGVSNTNMHLRAGAGRSARVLVPCPPEWRWMAAGDESPWFPGFRIYRQRPDGTWGDALTTLASDLRATLGSMQ